MNKEEYTIKLDMIATFEDKQIRVEDLLKQLFDEHKQLKEQLGKLLGLNETDFWLEYNRDVWKIQQENEKLKDNWNKLKEELWYLRNIVFTKEFGNEWKECLSFNNDVLPIINKMQELEKGDSNE